MKHVTSADAGVSKQEYKETSVSGDQVVVMVPLKKEYKRDMTCLAKKQKA